MSEQKLTIYYLSSTHWDREWYQPFQGFRYRLVSMMNDLMEKMEKNPEFSTFHLDGQTIVLEDYLEIEGGKKERLAKLISDGRVLVGPWYVMPDEYLLSGESLIRNLMMGHRIAKEWGVKPWKYGYICDIFGHAPQTPQIFNGFGIQYALLGRGTNEEDCPAHFRWQSPDGSECITFKLKDNFGYGDFYANILQKGEIDSWSDEEISEKLKEYVKAEQNRSGAPVVLLMDGLDHEHIHPSILKYIRILKDTFPNANVRLVSLEEMGKELEAYRSLLPVKKGELHEPAKERNPFNHVITHTLSSRYPVKKANDMCQILLEKWVEPLTAIADLRGLSLQKSYTDLAYKYLIQNHPHDSICGCSVDQVHKDMEYRFDQTMMISDQLIGSVMEYERSKYTADKESSDRVLLLWNPLPFPRKEVVTVDIDFNTQYPAQYNEPFGYEQKNSFKIIDHNGGEIPYGLVSMKKNYSIRRYNQFVETVDIHQVSLEVEVPAMGTAEYHIVPFERSSRYLDYLSKNEREVENEFLKLHINDNGTISITDKRSHKTYDRLLSYLDDGEIGDGWFHANPAEDRLISSFGSECVIERVENGPSRAVFKVTNYMRVPEEMDYYTHGIRRSRRETTLIITSHIGLSKGSSFVDVETTVSNQAKDHRLRMKLSTGIKTPSFFSNQAFSFVERATGINLDTQDWRECDVPERPMAGIVGKRSEDGSGIAVVSAYGLHECSGFDDEQGSLTVTLFRSFRKTVMTSGEESGQIQGDLSYKYGIMPMEAETTYADLIRLQDTLQAGMKSTSVRVAKGYEIQSPSSYFELSGKEICMSMLKRPENEARDEVIVRLYNPSARDSKATLACFKGLAAASEVNLNEEFVGDVPFSENSIDINLGPWKIQTYRLKFVEA